MVIYCVLQINLLRKMSTVPGTLIFSIPQAKIIRTLFPLGDGFGLFVLFDHFKNACSRNDAAQKAKDARYSPSVCRAGTPWHLPLRQIGTAQQPTGTSSYRRRYPESQSAASCLHLRLEQAATTRCHGMKLRPAPCNPESAHNCCALSSGVND